MSKPAYGLESKDAQPISGIYTKPPKLQNQEQNFINHSNYFKYIILIKPYYLLNLKKKLQKYLCNWTLKKLLQYMLLPSRTLLSCLHNLLKISKTIIAFEILVAPIDGESSKTPKKRVKFLKICPKTKNMIVYFLQTTSSSLC